MSNTLWQLGIVLLLICSQSQAKINNEILIIVSFDAFRNEYFNRNVTDYMNDLRINNTRAEFIRNIFPTKTYPNHHTIATGVFAEQHGVMANELYDHVLGKKLSYSSELFEFKNEIIPIWTLNEQAGGVSGCMMWPGSDFEYSGKHCTHGQHYNPAESFKDRIDEAFSWINHPTKPANLIMFYIEEPDTHGHAYGPESDTITKFVKKLSEATEYMHQKIVTSNLLDRVNVVHLSDHGMDSLLLKNVIDLNKIISNDTISYYGSTPILQIIPKNDKDIDIIYNKLLNASTTNGHFKVYLNSNLPQRWHFNNKIRIGPITALADLGYGFQDMFTAADYYEKTYKIPKTPTTKYGVHGYDNIYDIMHPIFFAYGHLIKTNNLVEPFDTVDLYYLFCDILNLQPPNYLKGNRRNIFGILKSSNNRRLSRLVVLTGSFFASFALVTVIMFGYRWSKRHHNQVPSYLYEETDTILDDQKSVGNYVINAIPSQITSMTATDPSTSRFQVV